LAVKARTVDGRENSALYVPSTSFPRDVTRPRATRKRKDERGCNEWDGGWD